MSGFVIDFGLPNAGLSGQTALGSNQATAYVLTKKVTVFSSVPTATGANLPSSYAPGVSLTLCNRDNANAMFLYPGVGDQIEANGINTPVTIPAGSNFTFVSFDPVLSVSPRTWWQTETYSLGSYLPLAGGTLTGPLSFAHWTTGGRPGVPTLYATGWNTTLSYLESWNGTAWVGMLQATGGTMTGTFQQTFTRVWSGGLPGANVANYSVQNYSGTTSGTFPDAGGDEVPLNLSFIQSDVLNYHRTGAGAVVAWNYVYRFGGAAVTEATPRVGFNIDVAMTGVMPAASVNSVAFTIRHAATANYGGAASGSGNGLGGLFAENIAFGNITSGTFFYELTGVEWDFVPQSGSSTQFAYGIKMVNQAPAGWQAYGGWSYLSFSTLGGDGAPDVILFGDPQGGTLPAKTTGNFLRSLAGTIGTGIDFSASTMTSLMKGPGSFLIDGSARVRAVSISPATGNDFFVTGSPGNDIILDFQHVASAVNYVKITNSVAGASPLIASTGATTPLGLAFGTANGAGIFQFVNSSGAEEFRITGVAAAVSYPSFTPAASGNILLDVGGTATGISIGRSAATGIAIGSATANTVIGGGAALATNATTGMVQIPSCAGVPSGNVGALGQVALIWDSTDNKLYVGVGGTWKGVVLA